MRVGAKAAKPADGCREWAAETVVRHSEMEHGDLAGRKEEPPKLERQRAKERERDEAQVKHAAHLVVVSGGRVGEGIPVLTAEGMASQALISQIWPTGAGSGDSGAEAGQMYPVLSVGSTWSCCGNRMETQAQTDADANADAEGGRVLQLLGGD